MNNTEDNVKTSGRVSSKLKSIAENDIQGFRQIQQHELMIQTQVCKNDDQALQPIKMARYQGRDNRQNIEQVLVQQGCIYSIQIQQTQPNHNGQLILEGNKYLVNQLSSQFTHPHLHNHPFQLNNQNYKKQSTEERAICFVYKMNKANRQRQQRYKSAKRSFISGTKLDDSITYKTPMHAFDLPKLPKNIKTPIELSSSSSRQCNFPPVAERNRSPGCIRKNCNKQLQSPILVSGRLNKRNKEYTVQNIQDGMRDLQILKRAQLRQLKFQAKRMINGLIIEWLRNSVDIVQRKRSFFGRKLPRPVHELLSMKNSALSQKAIKANDCKPSPTKKINLKKVSLGIQKQPQYQQAKPQTNGAKASTKSDKLKKSALEHVINLSIHSSRAIPIMQQPQRVLEADSSQEQSSKQLSNSSQYSVSKSSQRTNRQQGKQIEENSKTSQNGREQHNNSKLLNLQSKKCIQDCDEVVEMFSEQQLKSSQESFSLSSSLCTNKQYETSQRQQDIATKNNILCSEAHLKKNKLNNALKYEKISAQCHTEKPLNKEINLQNNQRERLITNKQPKQAERCQSQATDKKSPQRRAGKQQYKKVSAGQRPIKWSNTKEPKMFPPLQIKPNPEDCNPWLEKPQKNIRKLKAKIQTSPIPRKQIFQQ